MLTARRRAFTTGTLIAFLLTTLLFGGRPSAASAQTAPAQGGADGLKETTVNTRAGQVRTVVPEEVAAPDGRPMRAGSLVVRFRSGARDDDKNKAHDDAGAEDVDRTQQPDTVRVKVDRAKVAQALAAYRGRGEVAAADPDYLIRRADTPNDPIFTDQWALAKVGAEAAWSATRGSSSIKIAVLDCGVYSSSSKRPSIGGNGFGHVDVRGKVGAERDFTGSPNGADDICDHGTHVSGIAAASTNNGVGVAGLGYNATIMNGKVLADNGSGTLSWVINGINWASANGAKVINMSLSGGGSCPSSLQGAVNSAWSAGVVIVAAAGNDGANGAGWPANCSNVVSVAATNSSDELASFSNYGTDVDVAAPGQSILSTVNDGDYWSFSGTSMATPHVAGLAALVWSTEHGTSPQAVVNRILSTSKQLTDRGWTFRRIDADTAIGGSTAIVPLPRHTLTVQKSGSGNGSVSATGLSCGASCPSTTATYDEGTQITLTATPASGSFFGSWSGCDSTSGMSCTVRLNADRTVTASFTQSRTLTVRKSGTGGGSVSGSGISCGTSCTSDAETYTDGTGVTLTATPASGSTFGGWSGCDSTSGMSCTVALSGDRTVTATFTKSVTAVTCAAPRPTFTVKRTAALTYSFTATPKVDPKCTVASIDWKTSKGQTASGTTATIVFPKKGTYTITVTVTDSSGKTGRSSRTMTIK